MILPLSQIREVPMIMECFSNFFDGFVGQQVGPAQVLDFSEPGFHTYRRSAAGFHFPGIPEEESMDAYTFAHTPSEGEIVFDAGAHAGATTYFFSRMVGSRGKVFAFEPDEQNYSYLLRNIELHHLTNVVPVKLALAGSSGRLAFNMDGTMAAGLTDYLVYSDSGAQKYVEAMTLADACSALGAVPDYVKMDIEGAEVAVVDSSRGFLRDHPVHFAIESFHRVDDRYTYESLDRIFPEIGYHAESSARFHQMFTWAGPR